MQVLGAAQPIGAQDVSMGPVRIDGAGGGGWVVLHTNTVHTQQLFDSELNLHASSVPLLGCEGKPRIYPLDPIFLLVHLKRCMHVFMHLSDPGSRGPCRIACPSPK
eukprot:1161729-Pelagomonas_calceolata.AAC.9